MNATKYACAGRNALFILAAILVTFYIPLAAAQSFTELNPRDLPRGSAEVLPEPQGIIPAPPLTFFTTFPEFDAACPQQPVEDFNSNNSAGVTACPGPFDQFTNDACYSTGDLMPGFAMDAILVTGIGDMVTIDAGFLGNPTTVVGPNTFLDDNEILFNPPVQGMSIEVSSGIAPGTPVLMEVWGAGNVLLGQISYGVPGFPASAFMGVRSDVPIFRVTFSGHSGDLYDNLSFGGCEFFDKEIVAGNDFDFNGIPDKVVEVGSINFGAYYIFRIGYSMPQLPPVMIKDVVPREWDANFLGGNAYCELVRADERRNLFSDSFITCYPPVGIPSEMYFEASARCFDDAGDPSCHPKECGAFFLNEGATMQVGRTPLDVTDPLCLAAVADINGGGLVYDGTGDEDGDGVDDYTEACVNFTDPCVDEVIPECGDCLTTGHGVGCEVPTCEALICGIDPFCCDNNWDGICVDEAQDFCVPDLCTAPPGPITLDPDYVRPAGR